jgi:hypothetical protein
VPSSIVGESAGILSSIVISEATCWSIYASTVTAVSLE